MSDTIAQAAVEIGLNGVDKLKGGLGQVKGMLGNLGITPATLGIVGVGGAIAYAVKRAMDWEKSNEELRSKLEAMGENADEASRKINSLAKAISSTTTESAGHVKALVMQAMQMGATSEEAQKLATIAIGAGKATGKSAEEILEGAVKLQHGMRNALDRSMPAMAAAGTQTEKLAVLTKLAGQGYQQLEGGTKTTEGAMEQLQKAVGSLYTDFGKLFLPVVKAVIGVFQDLMDWIRATVDTVSEFNATQNKAGGDFSTMWSSVGKFFSECAEYIGKIILWVCKQFMLIPAYGELIGISVMNLFMNLIPAYLKAFGQNFVILCTWVYENWRDIFATMWNYLKAGFTNTLENIKALWTGLLGFIKGQGFHVEWKSLTDGAVNEMKKMPQFVKVQTDPIWDKMQKEAMDKVKRTGEAFDTIAAKHAPTAENKAKAQAEAKSTIGQALKEGLKPVENLKQKESGKGSSMSGILDVWKNAQQSVTKNAEKEKLQVAKATLTEQRKTNAHLSKLGTGRKAPALQLSRN
jgi:hypothetical protein